MLLKMVITIHVSTFIKSPAQNGHFNILVKDEMYQIKMKCFKVVDIVVSFKIGSYQITVHLQLADDHFHSHVKWRLT